MAKQKLIDEAVGELIQLADAAGYLRELMTDLGEITDDQAGVYLGCIRGLTQTAARLVGAMETAQLKGQSARPGRSRVAEG